MCVCAGRQGASRGARGLHRAPGGFAGSAHSWQQERSGPQAPCKPAAHPPCKPILVTRSEQKPDLTPGSPVLVGIRGCRKPGPPCRGSTGTRGLVTTLSPCLGAGPTPGLRWDTHSQGTRPIPGQKVGPEQGPPGRHHLGAPPVLECARLSRAATDWGGAEAGGMEAQRAYGARAPRTPFLGMSAGPQPQHHL